MPDLVHVLIQALLLDICNAAMIAFTFGSTLIISRYVMNRSVRLRKADMALAFAGYILYWVILYVASDIIFTPKFKDLSPELTDEEHFNAAKGIRMTDDETLIYDIVSIGALLLIFFLIFLLKHKRKKISSSLISTLVFYTLYDTARSPIYYALLLLSRDWREVRDSLIYIIEPDADSILSYLVTTLVYIVIFFCLFFGLHKKDRMLRIKPVYVIVLCVLFIFVNQIGGLPFSGEYTEEQVAYHARIILALFIPLILFTVTLILILDNLREKQRAAIDFQAKYLEAELSYISQYKRNENETRKFRHDIINNLSLMDMMVKDGHVEEAREHLKQMLENINSLSRRFSTGDEMLDLIVTMKASAMEDEKISFSCSGSLEEDLGMKAFDICGIFAGALDGAIEGCKADKDAKDSTIDMLISENETSRIIKISSSSKGDQDRVFSGKINSSCIKAYGGTVRSSVKDNISELILTFPRMAGKEAVNA